MNVPPEVGGLAKEIFRQNVEGIAWLLTAAHSKTGEREGKNKQNCSTERNWDLPVLKMPSLSRWHMTLKLRNGF